jgi:hypothetical protein
MKIKLYQPMRDGMPRFDRLFTSKKEAQAAIKDLLSHFPHYFEKAEELEKEAEYQSRDIDEYEVEIGTITAFMQGGVFQGAEATGILSVDCLKIVDHDEEGAD